MKHIKTFESFLNEAELNEARGTKKLSIPAKMTTVTNKIKINNPWTSGQRIAEVFEKNWDDILDTAKSASYQYQFSDALAKKDYMIELSTTLHLDINHMLSTIILNYF